VITVAHYNQYYQPVLERILEPARAILFLQAQGTYTITNISPAPLPFTYNITHAIAPKHYSLPHVYPPSVSYRRDDQLLALELLVDTGQSYTVYWQYNGLPQAPLVIPSLTNPSYPLYQRTPIYPFAHNHLAGYVYDVHIVGNYVRGGMDIAVPNTHSGIVTVVCVPLGDTQRLYSAYRAGDGVWRIIIRSANGQELADGTPIDTMVRVYIWSYYR